MAAKNEMLSNTNGLIPYAAGEKKPVASAASGIHKVLDDEFQEEIRRTFDLANWRSGVDLSQDYGRIDREVREAIARDDVWQKRVRDHIFPRLKESVNVPNAGVHPANPEALAKIHHGLLFNGGLEAADGRLQVYATLPLTVYQIGVSLVSYSGEEGNICQRLFRRDLRQTSDDPVEDFFRILEDKSKRTRSDGDSGELLQKALLDYAERAILLRRSQAVWRMGHGNPITYELLTGGGNLELMVEGTTVMRRLVENHKKFVYVASEPRDVVLWTIAQALPPWHFAIVRTLDEQLQDWLHQQRFKIGVSSQFEWDDGELLPATEWIPRFIRDVASKIAVGIVRGSQMAPAHLFYAHVDHADIAAHVVIADSMLQDHRGSPLLLHLARHVCDSVFGSQLENLVATAFANAGAPGRYVKEKSLSR